MPPPGSLLRFDEIEIDLAGRRLRRAGVEQPLEPKAYAVLLLLLDQAGCVLERDHILDAVWGHTHVTPGTLNRIITLLRHALGEDAHAPRYLHTVHGVGYRFDAAVETAPVSTGDIQAATSLAGPVAPDADRLAPAATREPIPSPTSPSSPDVGGAGSAPRAAPRARGIAWLALLALVAAGAWLVSIRGGTPPKESPTTATISPQPAPRATPPRAAPVLVVLPLRPLGDARGAAFADGLSEELLNLLARIEGLRVTSRTSSFHFRDSGQSLADIAHRLGATHVLEGSVRQDGERLRISLRLVDAAGDQTLWSETYDRQFRDIFDVQDSIARAVGTTLQLELGLGATVGNQQEDPELYRRYLVARRSIEIVSRLGAAEVPAGAEDLRVMVHEHPEYPRAWGGLATLLWALSNVPRPGRDALLEEADAAAVVALGMDPDQPDAHAVLAGKACREQRWAECLERSRTAVQNAPSDSLWRSWHAARLATMGYVDQALREQQQAVELDPLGTATHLFLGRLLDTLGRHEDALPHLRLAGLPAAHTASFFNAVWRGDLVEARRLATLLDPEVPWRASQLATVDALQDPAKLPHLMSVIEAAEHSLLPDDLRSRYDFNRLFLPERDYARDITGLDAVQRAGYASYQWVFWMPGESALRRSPAFQKYVRESGLLAFWQEAGWPDVCRSDGKGGVACD